MNMYQIWLLIDGLINLLNNDYYLDLKTEAINRYIETIINNHITNPDIHFSWGDVEYLVTSTIGAAGLTRNTLVTLPIYKSKR
jgi:hypothetical protein